MVKSIGIALAAFAAMAAPAFANLITITGTPATITCTPVCSAIVGGSIVDQNGPGLTGTAGSLSGSNADLYAFSPSDGNEEARALNVLAGTNFSSGTQTDTGSASAFTINTLAQWIVLKIGNLHFFINNPGGALQIVFAQNGARAGGLSHYTEFGQSEIPVPGALWLMGAGLAGLGFANRRKKA